MKSFALALLTFLSMGSFASDDLTAECKNIVKDSCGTRDIQACMKDPKKNKDLETCFGVLLKDGDAPKQVQSLQSTRLFDASKASCFTTVAQGCGTMEVPECMEKKGNLFPSECRDLFYEIQEQQARMASISGHCFKQKFDSCQSRYDVPLDSYDGFMGGLKSTEYCVSNDLLNDSACMADIKAAAEKRAKEEEAKKAEEEAKKEKKKAE